MLKGHRFYDSFFRVVSRLPVATALSAKTALGIVQKPLEKLQGGHEFYDIIARSNREPLPAKILSKVEKTGAYAVKYVAKTAGFVFLDEKSNIVFRDSPLSFSGNSTSESQLLLSIAKDPTKLNSYLLFAKLLKENGKILPAVAFFQFVLRKAPWDLNVRHDLAYTYFSIGAIRLAEGMALSVLYDDVRRFFPNAQQYPDLEEMSRKARKLINIIQRK
jgi:hypothetical protein